MASFDLVTLAAVVLAVGGLAAVLWEILAKNPGVLVEMMDDSRRFAEAPLASDTPRGARRSAGTAIPAANSNISHADLAA